MTVCISNYLVLQWEQIVSSICLFDNGMFRKDKMFS